MRSGPAIARVAAWCILLAVLATVLAMAPVAQAEVCNVKVVTDANPDYTDIGSMIYSITSNWPQTKDKCWALFWWNHIARRQTAPMIMHGVELTDPIRQFNDYGYTMCSTVAGVNVGIWGAMGLNGRFWDISMHTVCDVEYDGQFHMYDSSLSALYTKCDGKTLAAVTEIGQDGACAASGGKTEPGHIAKYHCLYGTSPNGYLTGADTPRSLASEYKCFTPKWLKYRDAYMTWDLGHRFIFNLRDNEVYTRTYHRGDLDSPNQTFKSEKGNYTADPAYYVPNKGKDPEAQNARYHIRGNGLRTWSPALTKAQLANDAESMTGLNALDAGGLVPASAGKMGEVVFKVEGANVICSMVIKAAIARKTADDVVAISVSTNNGKDWAEVYKSDKTGDSAADVALNEPVNGAYEVLVKVSLTGKASAADAALKSIGFSIITMVNSKTQPSLRLGKNTVYVGAGEQTESVVIWPELQNGKYKQYSVEDKNVVTVESARPSRVVLSVAEGSQEGYVVFRVDTPRDMTRLTMGGRLFAKSPNSRVQMLYSLDEGKTWTKVYELADNTPPWDVIHYEKVDVPPGHKSALVKYLMIEPQRLAAVPPEEGAAPVSPAGCGLYAVRMEANYKPADTTFKPLEVTYTWQERQEDFTKFVTRSHTQFVEKVPFRYEINVGGVDHPIVDSLRVSFKGAAGETKSGYSDGNENASAVKVPYRWATYGTVLSTGKPYTTNTKSDTQYGAGDPKDKILTDGVVGYNESGGTNYHDGVLYSFKTAPEIVVDLGQAMQCGVFRIHMGGRPQGRIQG